MDMKFRTTLKLAAKALILPAMVLVATIPVATARAAEPPKTAKPHSAATPQEIAQWIGQLGSDNYQVREEASDDLIQSGRSAIDATVTASQKDDLEVTTRAVQILGVLLKSNDIETADAAAAALTKVAAVRNSSTAAMAAAGIATDALAEFELARQEQTLAEIRRLGGSVNVGNPLTGNPDGVQVLLESEWHGGTAGLKLLKRVPNLEHVGFHGVAITDADLSLLDGLPRLASVELFGTKVSPAGAQKLAQTHPGAKIDRRGAKLGIMGDNGTCRITLVQPGSAAEAAGLLPDDVVLKIRDRAVTDFAGLTAEIGACEPGDKVTLEINRGNDTLKKEVTLGAWK